jgi:hypothetical protein
VPDEAGASTVKDVDESIPLWSVQVGLPIMLKGLLVIVQLVVSAGLKPLPEIDTEAPGLANVGLSVIFGAAVVRVNMA